MDPKLSASLERIITIYLTYLVMKYGSKFPGFDASIVPDLIVVGGSVISLSIGLYKTRKTALIANAAAAAPDAKILLDPRDPDTAEIAKATPSNVTIDPSK